MLSEISADRASGNNHNQSSPEVFEGFGGINGCGCGDEAITTELEMEYTTPSSRRGSSVYSRKLPPALTASLLALGPPLRRESTSTTSSTASSQQLFYTPTTISTSSEPKQHSIKRKAVPTIPPRLASLAVPIPNTPSTLFLSPLPSIMPSTPSSRPSISSIPPSLSCGDSSSAESSQCSPRSRSSLFQVTWDQPSPSASTRKSRRAAKKAQDEAFDADTPPTLRMLYQASLLDVIDEYGRRIPFGDLVRNKKVIVIFIRHWFCPLCAQYMNSILAQVSLSALERAGVELIIIGNGSSKMIDGYKNKYFQSPFKTYTDPTLALYRALGLTRQTGDGGPEDLKGDYLVQTTLESTVNTIKRATKMPLKNPGHFTQLGGEFIFNGTLNVSFAHRMTNTRSHAPIRDICKEAGVDLEWIHYEPGAPPLEHRYSWMEDQERDEWVESRAEVLEGMRRMKSERRKGSLTKGGQEVLHRREVRVVGQDDDEGVVDLSEEFAGLGLAR